MPAHVRPRPNRAQSDRRPPRGNRLYRHARLLLRPQARRQFVLRIEDTDQTRCTPESEQAIFDSLKWLGLAYDEGPDVGGEHGPYRQSERSAAGIYEEHVQRLLDQGDAYYCFCTADRASRRSASSMKATRSRSCMIAAAAIYDPKEAAARGCRRVPRHPHEGAARGEHTYKDRLRKQPVVKPWADIDDQVLIKSDGWPTYHFAAVVDDHLMGITHVIRAEEWLNSLPKHVWLNERLGWDRPEYIHVGLLRNADKSKISKRKNPTNVLWYRDRGFLPEAMVNFLALLGHSHPDEKDQFDLDELIRIFDLDRLNVGGPVFDMQKLEHIQGLWFQAGFAFARAVDARVDDLVGKAEPHSSAGCSRAWPRPSRRRRRRTTWLGNVEALNAFLDGLCTKNDWQRKVFFMALRVALTGRKESPGVGEVLWLIGRPGCSSVSRQQPTRSAEPTGLTSGTALSQRFPTRLHRRCSRPCSDPSCSVARSPSRPTPPWSPCSMAGSSRAIRSRSTASRSSSAVRSIP